MQPGNLLFFIMLFISELFIVLTFSFIFDSKTFNQLFIFSAVMSLFIGFVGLLRMQKQVEYPYIDAQGGWH